MSLAKNIKSATAIAPTMEVSFNKNKQLAPIDGIAIDIACGRTIYLNV